MRISISENSARRAKRAALILVIGVTLVSLICGICCRGFYSVRVDGVLIGYLRDESELREALYYMLAEKTEPEASAAYFKQRVSLDYGIAPVWRETDISEVSMTLNETLEVISERVEAPVQVASIEDGIVYRK